MLATLKEMTFAVFYASAMVVMFVGLVILIIGTYHGLKDYLKGRDNNVD